MCPVDIEIGGHTYKLQKKETRRLDFTDPELWAANDDGVPRTVIWNPGTEDLGGTVSVQPGETKQISVFQAGESNPLFSGARDLVSTTATVTRTG